MILRGVDGRLLLLRQLRSQVLGGCLQTDPDWHLRNILLRMRLLGRLADIVILNLFIELKIIKLH